MSAPNSSTQGVVGIVGAGHLGQAMAQVALRAGRAVVLANSRGPETLAPLAQRLGAAVTAATVQQAAAAPIVVLAVMWEDIPDAIRGIEWSGQVLIDATNDFDPAGLDGRTSSEIVAELSPGVQVVKAANTMEAAALAKDPHEAGGQRVIFISGDGQDAKEIVAALFRDAGYFPIDLGGLIEGGRLQQMGGPLSGHNLIRLS